jgi:hypothetical protein
MSTSDYLAPSLEHNIGTFIFPLRSGVAVGNQSIEDDSGLDREGELHAEGKQCCEQCTLHHHEMSGNNSKH